MFLTSLDLAVNVALPDITADLGTDLRTVQWIIVLYVGSSVSLQLGLGSAADVYGLRRFYIIGLAAYALAVLLIGLAPTLPIVLALRVTQAIGNGLLVASAPALITATTTVPATATFAFFFIARLSVFGRDGSTPSPR